MHLVRGAVGGYLGQKVSSLLHCIHLFKTKIVTMKQLSTIVLLLLAFMIRAQDCEHFESGTVFNNNELVFEALSQGEALNAVKLVSKLGDAGDLASAKYASLIYASNLWVGGVDGAGAAHVAGGKYGLATSDWYPGPLMSDGSVPSGDCSFWDQIFMVTKDELLQHYYASYDEEGNLLTAVDCEAIPESIKMWPAQGNAFLAALVGAQIMDQAHSNFYDHNDNGIYEPCLGDFPAPPIDPCNDGSPSAAETLNYMPDQLAYWIMNDVAGPHELTGGLPLGIEVHNYAYSKGVSESQEIFWTYTAKNKGEISFEDFQMSVWFDYDLGCSTDDLAGVSVADQMVYFYNEDAVDGTVDNDCSGDISTFEDDVPMVGMVMLLGLESEGMSAATLLRYDESPQQDQEFFNLMQGKTIGGLPYLNPQGDPTPFLFSGRPAVDSSWSMCSDESALLTYKTEVLLTSGGVALAAGDQQQITTALVYTNNAVLPCPSLAPLQESLLRTRTKFDGCLFELVGPSAPNLIADVSSTGFTLSFDNDYITSNNVDLSYSEVDIIAPTTPGDITYVFEGYKIYQVGALDFDMRDLLSSEHSQLVHQSDLQNGVSDIFNWFFELGSINLQSQIMVEGEDIGIPDGVEITSDALTGSPLDPTGKYYFVAVAYGHNEYEPFDPDNNTGQRRPYIEGRHNVKVIEVDLAGLTTGTADWQRNIETAHLTTFINGFSVSRSASASVAILHDLSGKTVGEWSVASSDSRSVSELQIKYPTGLYVVSLVGQDGLLIESKKVAVCK